MMVSQCSQQGSRLSFAPPKPQVSSHRLAVAVVQRDMRTSHCRISSESEALILQKPFLRKQPQPRPIEINALTQVQYMRKSPHWAAGPMLLPAGCRFDIETGGKAVAVPTATELDSKYCGPT